MDTLSIFFLCDLTVIKKDNTVHYTALFQTSSSDCIAKNAALSWWIGLEAPLSRITVISSEFKGSLNERTLFHSWCCHAQHTAVWNIMILRELSATVFMPEQGINTLSRIHTPRIGMWQRRQRQFAHKLVCSLCQRQEKLKHNKVEPPVYKSQCEGAVQPAGTCQFM